MKEFKFSLVRIVSTLSLLFAIVLLLSNVSFVSSKLHNYLSSLPLALAGVGYFILQIQLRPDRETFLKRMLLALSFVVWAIVQLLAPGRIATFLGDLVIAAYVLDLAWIVEEQAASSRMLDLSGPDLS